MELNKLKIIHLNISQNSLIFIWITIQLIQLYRMLLKKCNFLWKLTLNGNPIILPEKDGFLNIPSLGWLEMKNCNITNLNENIFRNLKRLVVIKLSNNHIAHIKPDLFSEMYHLRYIHLENNAISEIDPQTFKNNVQLEWLYIGHNSIYSISNEHFLNASALILLDLSFSNNSLTTFEINNFPRSLEFLDLSDNNLMNLILPNKSKPKRSMLKYVDLSGNPIGLACDEICYIWKSCSDRSGNMCGLKTLYAEFIRSNCSSCHLEDSRNLEILLSDNYVILNESKNAENTSDIENEQSDIISVDTDLDLRVENETNNYNQSNDISKRNKLPEDTKGILNTILYSIIGFAAVLCILLLAVLVVKISLGFMISRRISRSSSVNMKGGPVSIHQRFDYVSVPKTNLPEIVPRHNIRRPYKRK
ncbi:hypothetical protein L9F63_007637 [Diploptera punctata]|uniref:Uncharacterized protein n=1 Tax=Diploptera punctata TaxID=6984 RepID=A0AAD8E3R5_DIPPU|nr:hypothetical protein L9F63_007637 [Diploptera punctata]